MPYGAGYLRGSDRAVIEALKLSYDLEGESVSAYRVMRVGQERGIEAPRTPFVSGGGPRGGEGGWSVFDFSDRTKRSLERLVGQGFAGKEGNKYYPLTPNLEDLEL